jgi:hypothetical protein
MKSVPKLEIIKDFQAVYSIMLRLCGGGTRRQRTGCGRIDCVTSYCVFSSDGRFDWELEVAFSILGKRAVNGQLPTMETFVKSQEDLVGPFLLLER